MTRRKNSKKSTRRIYTTIKSFGAIIAILMFIVLAGNRWGFDFALEYVSLIPSMILIMMSIYGIINNTDFVLMGSFFMLGIGFAVMTGQLNTLGIIIPSLITPTLPLRYLQLVIIVFNGIIGAVFSGG